MYSWSELLAEQRAVVQKSSDASAGIDFIFQKKRSLLRDLASQTGRNTILYFSSFLHKPSADASINDKDINAFMENVRNTDKTKGLDLILHTPGGDLAATEQIIFYLKSYYGGDIRAIVPQMAMSAGSMIAVSCRSVVMGRQSCLGPFDPQMNGVACQTVIREFYNAVDDIKKNPASLGLWQTIISKLTPTFLTLCQQANQLSVELTDKILSDKAIDDGIKESIKKKFADNSDTKTHSRHINRDECVQAGLTIEELESNQTIQDLVLGIHHCCMILGESTNMVKIVENNIGGSFLTQLQVPQAR